MDSPDAESVFFLCFSWSIVVALFVERVLHAIVYFIASLGLVKSADGVRRFASITVVKEGVSGVFEIVQGVVLSLTTLFSYWALFLLAVIVVFFAVVIMSDFASVLTTWVSVYNSEASSSLRSLFLTGLQWGEYFIRPFILTWNSFWFVFKGVFFDVLVPVALKSPTNFLKFAGAISDTTQATAVSFYTYTMRFNGECSIERLVAVSNLTNTPCFVPGRRALDLMTPIGEGRVAASYFLVIAKDACQFLTAPLDLLFFPLLDINFAKSVHNFVNAILYWLVGMPVTTFDRCKAVSSSAYPEGHWFRLLMCIPDTTPGFNYLVAAMKRLGQMLDNWLNASWMIVVASLGMKTPECAAVPLTFKKVQESTLFGGNRTRYVGLSDGAYGLTDGTSAQWVFFNGQIREVFAPYAWGENAVDIKHGLAAVSYAKDSDDATALGVDASSERGETLSMMGCRCDDVPQELGGTQMQISCSILRYDAGAAQLTTEAQELVAPLTVPVSFFSEDTATYMTCAQSKIVVDSARFPLWRLGEHVESGKPQNFEDPLNSYTRQDGTDGPAEIDAVLYVMPACDVTPGSVNPECSSTFGGCFPYCIAARPTGSRNDGMILYNAHDWEQSIQVLDRNCAEKVTAESSTDIVEFYDSKTSSTNYNYRGLVYSNLDIQDGQFVFYQSWDPEAQECTYNPTTRSRVKKGTAITRDSELERFAAVLLREQPFVFAGETALTLQEKNGEYTVRVQRLFGQEGTGFFSLITTNAALQAAAPCKTPSDCGESNAFDVRKSQVTTPYSVFNDPSIHNPAVMSKWGVFWAWNPSYSMYTEFFKWCKGQATDLQIMIQSSHGPIRIFRANAFAYDNPNGAVRAENTGTFRTVVESGFLDGISQDACFNKFNLRVESMEFLNDANIAVEVLYGSPFAFDPEALDVSEANLDYRIYFLNPDTMRMRMGEMWPLDDAPAVLAQGLLCPNQRRFPELGSMAMETLVAPVQALRLITELILTAPVVFRPGVYQQIQTMNLPVNYGHSFLLNQGIGWLDFDLVFKPLRRANTLFWQSITKLGTLFDDTPYVNQFLNGISLRSQDYTPLVTRSMRDYLGAAQRISEGVDSQIDGMVKRVAGNTPAAFVGLSGGSGILNMGQYFFRMLRYWIVSVIIGDYDVIQTVDTGSPIIDVVGTGSVSSGLMVASLWRVLYDTHTDYKSLVLSAELRGCVGLELMLGFDNPLAQLTGSLCEAGVLFKEGAVNVATSFFVDTPMLACMCVDSLQRDFKKHVMDTCYASAPIHFRGTLLELIQNAKDPQDLCEKTSERVQMRIQTAMDPFLAASYEAIRHTGNTIDYFRIIWDESAGTCQDFVGEPGTMVMIPDPVDYWRSCAWTDVCRTKCLAPMQAFETQRMLSGIDALQAHVTTTSVATVESRFFSDEEIQMGRVNAPFEILAIAEMATCSYTCGNQDTAKGDRCVAIAGLLYEGAVNGDLTVAEYCVPRRVDSFVREVRRWTIAGSASWATSIMDIQFLHQGRYYCRGFTGAYCSMLIMFGDRLSAFREDGGEYIVTKFTDSVESMVSATQMIVLGNNAIVVDGRGYAYNENGDLIHAQKSLCIDTSVKEDWGKYPVNLCPGQNVLSPSQPFIAICQYPSNEATCASLYKIPTLSDVEPVQNCLVESNGRTGRVQEDCTTFPLAPGTIREAGLYRYIAQPLMGGFREMVRVRRSSDTIIASSISNLGDAIKYTDEKHVNVFVANHPKKSLNWLAALRIDTRAQNLKITSSETVKFEVSVEHGCDVDDCTGCTGLTRNLCYAAQQCTVSRCIGITVNLDKYLCAGGEILADALEYQLQIWQSSWTILSGIIVEIIAYSTTGSSSEVAEEYGGQNTWESKARQAAQSGTQKAFSKNEKSENEKKKASGAKKFSNQFTNLICLQKDAIYDIAAFITSFINTNVNVIQGAVAMGNGEQSLFTSTREIFDMDAHVSGEYEHAQRTLVLASVTRLFGNVGLGLIYPQMIAQKATLCQGNDLMSILDTFGFRMRVVPEKFVSASDAIVGKCLTNFQQTGVQEEQSVGTDSIAVMNSILDDSIAYIGTLPFGPHKHILDGVLSYTQSLVRGIQDVIQTADVRHCKLRDPTTDSLGKCACGDSPVGIPVERGDEGLAEHAFWCTGIMKLLNPFGEHHYVWNPYTYNQLVAKAATLDTYLKCLSTNPGEECEAYEPRDPLFDLQAVPLIAVLSRCKANYQAMQWDEASVILYADASVLPKYMLAVRDQVITTRSQAGLISDSTVSLCMINALRYGLSNDACLLDHIRRYGVERDNYFSYRTFGDDASGALTADIAACEVFSGPRSTVGGIFEECSTSAAPSLGCSMQPYIWSSRSRGSVPVANLHGVGYTQEAERFRIAETELQLVQQRVLTAIEQVNRTWLGQNLKVGLFSAEGDFLHQAFDCALLGPFSKTELFPTDLSGDIPTLEYYRDSQGGVSREFSLPCMGEDLLGDPYPPFTCGSSARRGIIKSFVRENVDQEGDESLRGEVVKAVLNQIGLVYNTYESISNLYCQCADGHTAISCCGEGFGSTALFLRTFRSLPEDERVALLKSFLPESVRTTEFDAITTPLVTSDLLDRAYKFIDENVLWNMSIARSFRGGDLPESLRDVDREIGAIDGFFQVADPMLSYGLDEVLDVRNNSAFDVCMGAVTQVFFTVPVTPEGTITTEPRMPEWNPLTSQPHEHLSAIEKWVHDLTEDARLLSPLYWSHRFKQVPSESGVCKDTAYAENDPYSGDQTPEYWMLSQSAHQSMATNAVIDLVTDAFTISAPPDTSTAASGSRDLRLGQLTRVCFCGWSTATDTIGRVWCKLPPAICTTFIDRVSPLIVRICSVQERMYWNHGDGPAVVRELQSFVSELGVTQCPWNRVDAPAWGILNATMTEAWLANSKPLSEFHVSPKDLLYEGRAGLRYMNAETTFSEGRDSALLLANIQDAAQTIALSRCENEVRTALQNDGDLLEHFRDNLFPTVQGVREPRAVAFCLRYLIELATLQIIAKVVPSADNEVFVKQIRYTSEWRRKCHTQTKILGFCSLRGAFRAKRSLTGVHNHPACHITFTGDLPGPDDAFHVAGSACTAVYTSGDQTPRVFDPCVHESLCRGISNAAVSQDVSSFVGSTPPIDVFSLIADDAKLLTARWADVDDRSWALGGSLVEEARARYEAENRRGNLRENAAAGMYIQALWDNYVKPQSGATGPAFGDTDESKWFQAKGKRAEDPRASCGGMPDWWPSKWRFPVGFHVSTPCDGGGLRTFQNQFVYEESNNTMRYEHEALRNETLMMNHAGASGFCRLNTYGQVLHERNNIRICTNQRSGTLIDYAVPILSESEEKMLEENERCSNSPLDVPWDVNTTSHPRQRSSGLLSSWFESTQDFWPTQVNDLGLPESEGPAEWSHADGECGMPPLFTCKTAADCTTAAAHDSARQLRFSCMGGVCMVTGSVGDPEAWHELTGFVECTAHEDCAEDFLCSGEGKCVLPVFEIANEYGSDVEIAPYSQRCDGESTDAENMLGKSPWGRIQNLLHAHGLCSYRSWYEYSETWAQHCAATPANQRCVLTENVKWVNTSKRADDPEQRIFEGLLKQEAHVCDRDYQYMYEASLCRPKVDGDDSRKAFFYRNRGGTPGPATGYQHRYSSLYQTYFYNQETSEYNVELTEMDFRSNRALGFLGTDLSFEDLAPQRCMDIKQCSNPPYWIFGNSIGARRVQTSTEREESRYRISDTIRCGPFGYVVLENSIERCKVDRATTPMIDILCPPAPNDLASFCPSTTLRKTTAEIEALCDRVQNLYDPRSGYIDGTQKDGEVKEVASALEQLLQGVFQTGFSDLQSYTERQKCAAWVFGKIENGGGSTNSLEYTVDSKTVSSLTTLYHFTDYSMVEVPPTWWVKCYMLSGLKASNTDEVICPAWRDSMGTTSANEDTEYGELTVREWLQRHAPSIDLEKFADLLNEERSEIKGRIKDAVRRAIPTVTGNVNASSLGVHCFSERRWILESTQTCRLGTDKKQFERLVYNWLSGIETSLQSYSGCCTGLDGCAPSVGHGQHPQYSDRNIAQTLEDFIDFYSSPFTAALIAENSDILKEKIRLNDLRVPLFTQPWMQVTEALPQKLVTYFFSDRGFPAVEEDECVQFTQYNPEYSTSADWDRRCIFDDMADDPKSAEVPSYISESNAKVILSSKESFSLSNLNQNYEMNVCVDAQTKPTARASTFLRQSCYLGVRGSNDLPSDDFKCLAPDPAIKCANSQQIIQNPNKRRVCYEMGNGCFNNKDQSERDKFVNLKGHSWKTALIPPGVRLQTYRYPETPVFIGRNPRYRGSYEKLYWNSSAGVQQFWSKSDVRNRLALLGADFSVKGFVLQQETSYEEETILTGVELDKREETKVTQYGGGRRLQGFWFLVIAAISIAALVNGIIGVTKRPEDICPVSGDVITNDFRYHIPRSTIPNSFDMSEIESFKDLRLRVLDIGSFFDYIHEVPPSCENQECCRCPPIGNKQPVEVEDEWLSPEGDDGEGNVLIANGCEYCPGDLEAKSTFCRTPQDDETPWYQNPLCCGCPEGFTQNPEEMEQCVKTETTTAYSLSETYGTKRFFRMENKFNDNALPPMMSYTRGYREEDGAGKHEVLYRIFSDYDEEKRYPPWFNCFDPEDKTPIYPDYQTIQNILIDGELEKDYVYERDYENWVRENLFIDNELKIYSPSSRQAYFAEHYEVFEDKWFDYGPPPQASTRAWGQRMTQSDVVLSGRYEAFSLELMDNFTCNRGSCTGGMPVKIYGDYWYCAECTRMPPFNRVCQGPHKCRVEGVRSFHSYEDKYIPLWQRSDVNNLLSRVVNEKRGPVNTETLSPSETIRLLAHYMLIEYRKEFEEADRGDLASMKFKIPITAIVDNTTQAVTHPSSEWPEQHLSPSAALTWEEQTGERDGNVLDIRRCLETGDASTNSISYELCSNDDQANVLKQGANEAYKKTGSLVVPDGYSLFLPLSALQLRASATLLTWSHGEREAREKHIEYLLNTEAHCARNDVTTALCRVRPEDRRIEFFNPWLGGDWSAESGCDIAYDAEQGGDRISSLCVNLQECGDLNATFYQHQVGSCLRRNGEVPLRLTPKFAGSSLCWYTPPAQQTRCSHAQGVLGNGYAGTPQRNLYFSENLRGVFDDLEDGGLFVQPRRAIFHQRTFEEAVGIDKSFLHFHRRDIAGHHLQFALDANGALKLVDVVLGGHGKTAHERKTEVQTLRTEPAAEKDLSWMIWDNEFESRSAQQHEPDFNEEVMVNRHWACPWKQRIFLSGKKGPSFRPATPNPRRAGEMFYEHSTNRGLQFSSTVQQFKGGARTVEADIKTSNGFCFCESLQNCQFPLTSDDRCGFQESVRALVQSLELSSHVAKGGSTGGCNEQLDWPYTLGQLRDGSWIAGNEIAGATTNCNLLDRIHDFQYRYVRGATVRAAASSDNTLPGGDCHTGRVPGTADPTWNPNSQSSCAQCRQPPSFRAGGVDIPAETSFGVPYRESSERAIAGNLREKIRSVVCGEGEATCDVLERLVNVSSWVPGEFWDAFLEDSSHLFNVSSSDDVTVKNSLLQEETSFRISADEVTLWENPWVYCKRNDPTCEEVCDEETETCNYVCSYAGNASSLKSCHGYISWSDWINPGTRSVTCKNMLLTMEDTEQGAIAEIDICDMDPVMNQLCVELAGARNDVFEINCRASGLCHDEKYFYTPSVFSPANQEFVKQTVETYYLQRDENSCPAEAEEAEEIRISNEASVQQCASTALDVVYTLIEDLRKILDHIVRIGYFSLMLALNLLRFLVLDLVAAAANQPSAAMQQVSMYWELLILELGSMFNAIGALFFNLIMKSPLGKALQAIIDALCAAINWVYTDIFIAILCPFFRIIAAMAGEVAKGVDAAVNILTLGFAKSQITWEQDILDWAETICDPNNLPCQNNTDIFDNVPQPTSLAIATRCWSSYVTFLGDSSSLACSAADTCRAKDISAVGDPALATSLTPGLQVCDSCPIPDPGESRFGCDLLTKQCACGVQQKVRTTCISNDECAFSSATCDIVDTMYDANTFGTIGCSQCTGAKICLVGAGDSVGHCACAIEPPSYSACDANARGQTVGVFGYSMCFAAIGEAVADEVATQATYTVESTKLATTRCDMLNAAQRFCMRVEMGLGISSHFIVGIRTIFQRRRLLADEISESERAAYRAFQFAISADAYDQALAAAGWEGVQSEVCRYAPRLRDNSTSQALGIVDTAALRSCVRWRAIGAEILHFLNVSDDTIPDTFLLSPVDFATDVAAHPNRFLAILQRPQTWLYALLHTEALAPVRVWVRSLRRWFIHTRIEALAAQANLNETVLAGLETGAAGFLANKTEMVTLLQRSGLSRHMISLALRLQHTLLPHLRANEEAPHAAAMQRSIRHRRMHSAHVPTIRRPSRKLLQAPSVSFVQKLVEVQQYSTDVALGEGTVQVLPGEAAELFAKGPISWPPKYVYWDRENTCNVATNGYRLLVQMADFMAESLFDPPPRPNISYSPLKAIDEIFQLQTIFDRTNRIFSEDFNTTLNRVPWTLREPINFFLGTGFDPSYPTRLAKAAPGAALQLVTCDVRAQLFCTKHRYSVITAGIVVVLFLFIISVLTSFLRFPAVSTILAMITLLGLTFFIAFEYSPFCAPIVPSCLFQSLVDDVHAWLPPNITIPQSLLTCPHDQSLSVPPASCIARCDRDPYAFTDATANAAWILCEASQDSCKTLYDWLYAPGNLVEIALGPEPTEILYTTLYRARIVLRSGDQAMIDAFRWCNALTSYQLLPPALLALALVSAVPVVLAIAVRFVVAFVRVQLSSYAMTHA